MALSLEQYIQWRDDDEIKEILMERLERQKELSMDDFVYEGDHFPEQLIVEILSWLPVRVLLQFKTVCKLWCTIIKSPHFLSRHLKNYYDNDSNWRECLIVQYNNTHARELMTYELLMDGTTKEVLSYQAIHKPYYGADICGPCNGLYFVWRSYIWRSYNASCNLWNPTLNEFKELPDNKIVRPGLPSYLRMFSERYGFGFDYKTKDYKVILIRGYYDTRDDDGDSGILDYPLSLFIYSLKSDSWRYWGDLKNTYYLKCNKSYVFVNSCYYWLGARDRYCNDYEVIISFDITADTYEEISLPKFKKKPWYGTQVIVYHGYISLACVYKEETNFSVWSWNEKVWTQTLAMEVGFEIRGAFCHWCDNMLIFRRSCGNLVLCDTNTEEIWILDDPRQGSVENIIVYKESLVSIMAFSSCAQLQRDYKQN